MLLIDTCGASGSLALAEEGSDGAWKLRATEEMPGRSASERLLPMLRATLKTLGWSVSELTVVTVVDGPGSFTGLRVGVSAAKGLCEGGDLPLVAISRLAVLADCAPMRDRRVIALLDAGRGEVFLGLYGGGRCEREELVTVAAALEVMAAEDGGSAVVCEEGVASEMGAERVLMVTEPSAASALRIAVERVREQVFADPATLDGNYLRRTETEIRQRLEARAQAGRGGEVG
jgi:tRNA threonylcarbamoyladenosine biosynthesis protein TsaB